MNENLAPVCLAQWDLLRGTALWEALPAWMASPLLWAVISGGLGVWLLLPKGGEQDRAVGAALSLLGLGLLFLLGPFLGLGEVDWDEEGLPRLLGTAMVVGAIVATVIAAGLRGKIFLTVAAAALFLCVGAWAFTGGLGVAPFLPVALSIGFLAAGAALFLPGRRRRERPAGVLLATLALGLVVSLTPVVGDALERGLFGLFAILTAVGAVATISSRSPVYAAMWFAATLLTTAGLLLLQEAAFLGVATVVVYAGAILVTFLFVLMLAQSEGHAFYDRVSWGFAPTLVASVVGVAIVGGLTHRLLRLEAREAVAPLAAAAPLAAQGEGIAAGPAVGDSLAAGKGAAAADAVQPPHMVRLGGELFGRHLIAVEGAGVLLLAALVGAVAMTIHDRKLAGRSALARMGQTVAAEEDVSQPGD